MSFCAMQARQLVTDDGGEGELGSEVLAMKKEMGVNSHHTGK